MLARAIPVVAMGMLACACTLDFDLAGPHGGEYQGGSSASAGSPPFGGSPDTGGAPPTCDGTCVPLGNFSGPFRLGDDSCESPLSAGYSNPTPPFTTGKAICTCACEPPTLLGCPNVSSTLYDETTCGGTSQVVAFVEGLCFAPLLAFIDAHSLTLPTMGGAANSFCQSNGSRATRPPVVFADPVVACEVSPASCGSSAVCLPDDIAGLCVIGQQGDACPTEFPDGREILLADELSDDRDCTCECGLLSASCTPNFEIFTDDACTMSDAKVLAPGCVSSLDGAPMEGIVYRPLASNASCTGSEDDAVGGVTSGPARMLCCAGD